MIHLGKILIAICLFGYGIIMQAQETTTVSGGNATGSGGTVSYTVGQVAYTVSSGTTGTVTQGVQQPYESFEVTGLEEAEGITLQCSVYPNPTTDYLVLKVENFDMENLSYQLIDINGKHLENKKITGNETSIVMSNLVPAIYFLKVTQNSKEVKSFKIIKN
jgi:hypothetical protein